MADHKNNFQHPVDEQDSSRGDKIAEKCVSFLGSWKFIIISTVGIIMWILWNGYLCYRIANAEPVDAYPFILLNLVFSAQAFFAAPMILMSGNLSARRDKKVSIMDYSHNVTTVKLLKAIHADLHYLDCRCYINQLEDD